MALHFCCTEHAGRELPLLKRTLVIKVEMAGLLHFSYHYSAAAAAAATTAAQPD